MGAPKVQHLDTLELTDEFIQKAVVVGVKSLPGSKMEHTRIVLKVMQDYLNMVSRIETHRKREKLI